MTARFLLLETSGRVGQVALADGEVLCAVRRLDEARRHARDLAPTVAELLRQQNWTPRQIDAVVVSRGPGSYTGLRVGLMSAMTFAYATGCGLLAVDTFAVIAQQAPYEILCIEIVADAQQGKIYRQRFERKVPGDPLRAASPLTVERAAEWLPGLPTGTWLSGPGLRQHQKDSLKEIRFVPEALWDPQPTSLHRLGHLRYSAGERDHPFAVEPLYLRPSAAEEQWQTRAATHSA